MYLFKIEQFFSGCRHAFDIFFIISGYLFYPYTELITNLNVTTTAIIFNQKIQSLCVMK